MKPILIAGIGLILLGIVALSYNRITYTTKEKIVDIGPIEATADKEDDSAPAVIGRIGINCRSRLDRGRLQEIISTGLAETPK
jgi:hypothetical protein